MKPRQRLAAACLCLMMTGAAGCIWIEEPEPDDPPIPESQTEPAASLPYGGSRPVVEGWGDLQQLSRPVAPFDRIVIKGDVGMTLTLGKTETLRAEAQTNIHEHLLSEVRGTTLYLGYKDSPGKPSMRPSEPVRFLVQARTLAAIELEEGAGANAVGLEMGRLQIKLKDDATLTIDRFQGEGLFAWLADDSRLEVLSGWADRLQVDIRGKGVFTGHRFETQSARVEVTGDGRASLRVKKALDVRLAGKGVVRYHGRPRVTKDIVGTGQVLRVGS